MKAVNNYLKNVMKSVTYAAADVVTDNTSGIQEFASTNKEFATATFAALKNPSVAIKKSVDAIQQSKVYKTLDYGARNLVEDLRTGNFYNKERLDRDELKVAGLDMDWDDLSEFGVDNDWENKKDSSSSDTGVTAGDMKIVQSIEGSNAAVASATVNAVIKTSNNQIKAARADTAMLYTQNERLFGGLHKDITVLGSTMNGIYKLQSATLQNMDKNMSDFFTSEAKLSAERNAILKEMLEMQRNMYKSAEEKQKEAAAKKNKNKRIRWSDINVNGMADINAYFGAVKKNMAAQMSSLGMGGFGEDGNLLATFAISPLQEAMKMVVNGIIPATVKAATKEFDSSLSGIFGNIIGELGNARSKNDGGIMGMLGKFFGINTSVNRNIDTSKYEKGPIPFDGITRKAIIDVIPTHLRRIEAAITGRPEEMFDYKAGKWVKASTIKKQFEDIRKSTIKSATSELREAMSSGVSAVKGGMINKRDREEFDKALEEFEQFLVDNNGRFNPKASAEKNGIGFNYSNLRKHYKTIQKIYSDFDVIEEKNPITGKNRIRHTKNRIRMQLSNRILDAKDAEERRYRDIETSVGDIFQQYFGAPKIDAHGKYNTKGDKFTPFNQLTNTKDELGNTIFNYLQNINKELTWVRLNGGSFGGGGGTSTGSSGIDFDKIDLRSNRYKTELNSSSNRDQAERERIKKSALNKIQSGKAISYEAFDTNEKEYLLALQEMMSNEEIKNYKNEIKGYNASAIASFMDKHFYQANIKTMEDINKAIKQAEKDGEGKNTNMDAKEEKFFQKIMKRIGSGDTVLGGIVGASSEAFTNLLYTADKAIYEMMYKTELKNDSTENGKKYNGFMDAMVGKMNETFKDVKKMLSENLIDPLKDRLGIDDEWKKRFKDGAIGVGSKFWGAFKDANSSVYGPMIDAGKDSVNNFIEKQQYKAKAAATKSRLQEQYTKKNGLSSEYKESNDEYTLMKRLSNIGIPSSELLRIRNECTTDEGELDQARYIRALNDLYKKERSKPKWIKSDKYDPLATKKQRDKRYKAVAGSTSDILKWGKKNHFYSEDENDLGDRLLEQGLVTKKKLDAIRNHSFDKDGNFKYDEYRAALIKIYNRSLTKNHARGTIGRPFSGLSTLTKGEGLINSHGFTTVPKTGVYNVTEPTHIINTEDMHTLSGGKGVRTSVQQALGKERLAAKAAGFNVAGNASGTIKITNSGVDVDPKQVIEEAKKYIPEAAGGGLVGGILSMVLGLAGGPILGAAVGAGGTIISKSETLQTKLFGKIGKDGKRDGSGLISKTVMDAVHKYAPDMMKYGLAGIIPGLLTPLGPVGGLLVGGAIGLLKNNERFTNKYFGEEGKLHIGSKEKEIISKMLPAALKGAGVGAVVGTLVGGPFGLLGNAALGSALGMMGSTEEFKNLILGEEINGVRTGGILEIIKQTFEPLGKGMKDVADKLIDAFDTNVIDPLARFINPAIHAIPEVLNIIPRKIGEKIMNSKIGKGIEGMLKDHVFTPMKKVLLGPVSMVAKGLGTAVTAPFRGIGKLGDKIQTKRITTRNASELTAQERIDHMIKVGKGDSVSKLDRALAAMGTGEEVTLENGEKLGVMSNKEGKAILDSLTAIHSTNDQITRSRKSQAREISRILNRFNIDGGSLSSSTKRKALRAIEAGDMKALEKALVSGNLEGKNTGLTQEQYNTLMEGDTGLKSKILKYNDLQRREAKIRGMSLEDEDKEKERDAVAESLAKFGISINDLKDPHERAKIMKLFETQLIHNEANGVGEKTPEELQPEELQNENNENIRDIRDILANISEYGIKVFNGDDEYIQKANEKAATEAAKVGDNIDAMFEGRSEAARNAIGAETYDALDDKTKDSFTAGSRNAFRRRKATAQNANIARIKKYGLNPEVIDAAGGDVEAIVKVVKKCGGITPEAAKKINSLSKTQMSIVMQFLRKETIARMMYGRKLDVADINFFLYNHARIDYVKNKCKDLYRRGYRAKDFPSFEAIMDDHSLGMNNAEEENSSEENIEEIPTAEPNGLGTLLLGKLFRGATGVAKAAGRGVKSLFSNRDNGGEGITSRAMGALGSILGNHGNSLSAGSGAGLDETDKKGDGKDVISVGGGDLITVKRDSSGNVEPDTSDSRTKTIMNKLSIKERVTEKLQAAQLKACEVIKNNFDTSEIKGSKKGKLGWFSMLLLGGLLLKSGLPQKLFNNMIKPLWSNHIKPWIDNKAVPWLKNMWNEDVWPLIKKAGNWILDVALPKAADLFGVIIGEAIVNLPETIAKGIKTAFGIAGKALDVATGNTYNAGATTTVNTSEMKDGSGITDANGKKLSGKEIGNLKAGDVVYNAQGAAGTVQEDGSITFEDGSMVGASYLAKEAKGGIRAFLRSLTTGRKGLLTRGANAITKKFAGAKGIKGLVGKGAHMLTAPISKAEELGVKLHGKFNNLIDNAAERAYLKSGENLDVLEKVTNGDGSKFTKWFQKIVGKADEGSEVLAKADAGVGKVGAFLSSTKDKFKGLFSKSIKNVEKEGAEKAVKTAVKEKGAGFAAKLVTKAKDAIEALFSNPKVLAKLKAMAKVLHMDNVAKWITKFKGKVTSIFENALEKGVKKVGGETLKKAASKILFVVFLVIDFVDGCDRAESILGVKETTVAEELTAGLINALCNLLIVPSIWPGTDTIARKIYAAFDEDLEDRQKEANKETEEYNKEHGTTYSTEELLKRKKSIGGKVGGWVSDRVKDIKHANKVVWGGIGKGVKWVADKAMIPFNTVKGALGFNAAGTMDASQLLSGNPLTGIFNAVSNNMDQILGNPLKELSETRSLDDVMTKAKEGRISIFSKDYWADKAESKSNTLTGAIKNIVNKYTKFMTAPMLMIKNSLETLSYDIATVGDVMSGKTGSSSSSSSSSSGSAIARRAVSKSSSSVTKGTSGTFLGKIKSTFGKAMGKVKSFFGFGPGPEYMYGAGDFSKQIDPSVSGIRYNSSADTEYQTIGNSGCGPAAAVNVLESVYGRGNAVADAASFAINHGYKETDGGTKPGFFTEYFNRNGLDSQTSYNRNQIERNINSGLPTVLMGSSANGTSSSTPFGRTPHYVTVTGTDGAGNAIVQDPESRYDNQLFPVKSLMKNTSLGVSAFGKSYGNDYLWGLGKKKKKSGTKTTGKKKIMFVGDSRTVGMKLVVGKNDNIWCCEGGRGIKWLKATGMPPYESKIKSGVAVAILMGVNDCAWSDTKKMYIDYFKDKVPKWISAGAEVYYVSINPINEDKYHYEAKITNAVIDDFNNHIKKKTASLGMKYIDTNSKLKKDGFKTYDGLHYDTDTSKRIYKMIVNAINNGVSDSGSTSKSSSKSSSSSSGSTTSEGKSINAETVGGLFSSIIVNSKAGKALSSIIGMNNSEEKSSSSSSSSESSSSSSSSSKSSSKKSSSKSTSGGEFAHPCPGSTVSSPFGNRAAPIAGASNTHNGIDLASPTGTPVYAAEAGKVTIAGWSDSAGNWVVIDHGKGIVTKYMHMSKIRVKAGQKVKRGQRIGDVGSTGMSTGPHLHFQVEKNGTPVDPAGLIKKSSKKSTKKKKSGKGIFGMGKWGRGVPNNEISKQTWAFFTKNGISPAATAGILGNAYAESGVDPTAIQGGGAGPAAGMFQWENYNTKSSRWKALDNYARSKKKKWTDLDAQLKYTLKELKDPGTTYWDKGSASFDAAGAKFTTFEKWSKSKDPDMATRQFEAAFERAGIPAIDKRTDAAAEYYRLYEDSNFKYNGTIDSSDGGSGGKEEKKEVDTVSSLLANIMANSPVGQALASIVGGSSSSSSSGSSDSSSSGSSSKGSADAASVVNIAKKQVGIKAKPVNVCKYNDWYYGRKINGSAYPWCAAFVSWVANQAGVPEDIIPKDAYTVTAYQKLVNNGGKISNSKAGPGDIIYFTDNGAPSGIYHTGIVIKNKNGKIDTIEGNSSDMVAKRSYNTNSGSILVARPQYDGSASSDDSKSSKKKKKSKEDSTEKNTKTKNTKTTKSKTSTKKTKTKLLDAPAKEDVRGGNGVKPLSRFGQFKESIYGTGIDNRGMTVNHKTRDGYVKVKKSIYDEQLGNAIKLNSRKATYSKPRVGLGTGQNTAVFGMGTTPNYSNLINTIITILMSIADNTDKLNTIVSILNDKLGTSISASDVSKQNAKRSNTLKNKLATSLANVNSDYSKFNSMADSIGDSSINSIIKAMNLIASE